MKNVRLNYYPETDSLYIDLDEGSSAESKEVSEGLVHDYDIDGKPVGIDIDRTKKILDKCDEGLKDKPKLAFIYNQIWRKKFCKKLMEAKSLSDLSFPGAYGGPYFFEGLGFYPQDYQNRLEEGANILLQKLNKSDKNNLVERLRGVGSCSAEEELLLARGFASQFEVNAIEGPNGSFSSPHPEFYVSVEGHSIAIEAKGLLDSKTVQDLNEFSISSGQYGWISVDPSIGDESHVRGALVKKILKSSVHNPCVIVLTLYGSFDFLAGIDLARQMAITPSNFAIPEEAYPLAVSLVSGPRCIQGIWFNLSTFQRIGISEQAKEKIRTAVKNSFWPRPDGVFLYEGMSNCEHNKAVDMIRSRIR
jgi:uncharacterized protein YuzE